MIRFDKKIETKYIKENEVLFDIETTGINWYRDSVFLIGYINGKTKTFTQLFSEDGNDREVLETFKKETEGFNYITYNGRSFDFPFINTRLLKYKLEPLKILEEYDLYYQIRINKKILGIKQHKLTYIEKQFGIERSEDIESKNIPKKYMDFLKGVKDYKKLLIHNKEDVLNTEKLLFLRDKIINEKTFFIKDNIKAYIESIDIEKDFLKIKIKALSPYNMPINYYDNIHIIKWDKDQLDIVIRIIEGKDKEDDICLYLSTIGNIKDKSSLNLDKNLLLISRNTYYQMENIRNLINLVIDYFIVDKSEEI